MLEMKRGTKPIQIKTSDFLGKLKKERQENCSKHQQSQIASLKARYNSIGISVINQKIKCQTDIIQRLRNKIKCLKEENKQLQKKKAETFETVVQCNTMKSYV